jgi:hypothetical protein
MKMQDLNPADRDSIHLRGVSGRFKPENDAEAEQARKALAEGASPVLDPFKVEDSPASLQQKELLARIGMTERQLYPTYFIVYSHAGGERHEDHLARLIETVNGFMERGEAQPLGGPFWTQTARGWGQAMLRTTDPGSPR